MLDHTDTEARSMTRIRHRDEADIGACVEALRAAHQASGYPTNWPADPDRWLRPSQTLQAWVAARDDMSVMWSSGSHRRASIPRK
jgi:hypothetical protein